MLPACPSNQIVRMNLSVIPLVQGSELEVKNPIIVMVSNVGVLVSLFYNKVYFLLLFHLLSAFCSIYFLGFVRFPSSSKTWMFSYF